MFVTSVARGQNLMRRMIALAMLRIGGIRAVPSVIVACTRNPICYRIMRETARHFTGAVFFPDPDGIAINRDHPNRRFQATTGTLRGGMMITAGASQYRPLAHDPQFERLFGQRLQPADRVLAMLDLRGDDEATILYRSR